MLMLFFFSSRRRHTRCSRDWSSDVCSSDLQSALKMPAYHTLHQLGGSESYAGIFNALCDLREITPLFFGFAIGAKVGCGLVAELGTMRINEEIDALETMGVPSVPFLVSTRMIACLLVLPLMYVLSLATSFFASWVVQRFQIGLVSNGVYFSYFWRFTNLTDFGYSVIKAVIFAFLVIDSDADHEEREDDGLDHRVAEVGQVGEAPEIGEVHAVRDQPDLKALYDPAGEEAGRQRKHVH